CPYWLQVKWLYGVLFCRFVPKRMDQPQSAHFTRPAKICVVASFCCRLRLAICFCTCSNTSRLMIASWVFSTRLHSSFGLRTCFLFLEEMLGCVLCTLLPI